MFFFPRDYAERKVMSMSVANSAKGLSAVMRVKHLAAGRTKVLCLFTVAGRENNGPLPIYSGVKLCGSETMPMVE